MNRCGSHAWNSGAIFTWTGFRSDQAGAFAKALMDKPRLLQSGAAHPRGVMMRECWKNRAGYDRVLMTVAATFLTVAASSAFAQNVAPRISAAELAIDAAVPRPEPANVPPPTASDFKLDTPSADTAKADANKGAEQAAPPTTPADLATAPISEPTKVEPAKEEANKADPSKNDAKNDTATVAPAQTPAPATAALPEPAKEPVKAASNGPA